MSKKNQKNLIKFVLKNKKIIIISSILIVALITISCLYIVPAINSNIRKNRIITIMNSIKIDDQKCYFRGEYLRGKVMSLDTTVSNGTTYTRDYACNMKVDTTVAYIKSLASQAGLIYVNDPYPGSAVPTLDYKTTKNEYIRISMSSKLRDDAFYNRYNMGISTSTPDLDEMVNSGPTNVMFLLNLDGIN